MKTTRIHLALLSLPLIFSSADSALAQQSREGAPAGEARALSQATTPQPLYACPMHPEETSHEPGNCRICGMYLVKGEAHGKDMGMSMKSAMPPGKVDMQLALAAAAKKQMPSEICLFPKEKQAAPPVSKGGMEMDSGMAHATAGHQPEMPMAMDAPQPDMAEAPVPPPQETAATSDQPLYACPMHPEETSHEPGNCRICGMFLVKSTAEGNAKKMAMDPAMGQDHSGHQHNPAEMPMAMGAPKPDVAETTAPPLSKTDTDSDQPLYACPMHPEETSHEPGSCRICGMFLVKSTAEGDAKKMAMDPAMEHDHSGHQHDPAEMPMAMGTLKPDMAEASVPQLRQQGAGGDQTDYVCPMHPQIVTKDPGNCPICGMNLEPVKQEDGAEGGAHAKVSVSPEIVQSLGIRVAQLQRMTFSRTAETMGYIEYDKTRLRHVYAPANGNVEGLTVRSEGERVEKGQFLFKLFTAALSDYYDDTFAQLDGIVVDLPVIEGQYVMPTTKVMTLADLSSIWVLADVFESQAGWIRRGQQAEVRTPNHPGRVWKGQVEYIYPSLDPETRTLKVRMRFDNPDEALLPNMLAEITIHGPPQPDILALPKEALIQTGHQQRVILALEDGHFLPHPVKTGQEFGDWIEVTNGLTVNDEVVVSGQFLIDSEASLKGSLARLHSH